MVLATSAASSITSRLLTSSNKNTFDENDGMEKAIFNQNSNHIDYDHLKDDELDFCHRMACYLTNTRDLPKLCQEFPSVVDKVNARAKEEHSFHAQRHHMSSGTHQEHHEEQHHDQVMMEINHGSDTGSLYVPPPSDR